MEHIQTFFHHASYIGGIEQLMSLSTTDITVLFLLSKPVFMLTTIAVLAAQHMRSHDAHRVAGTRQIC
ncbi:MAG: hypothetical protein ACOCV2_09570 [Persicimonas sp.]